LELKNLDHFVLTVKNINASCDFYHNILGMRVITFNHGRKALRFANMKINLHEVGHEFEPKALHPTPGSADLCLITTTPLSKVVDELHAKHIQIEQGPIAKSGALGPIKSVYFRDPDRNLVEVSTY
jgi:catechol 2,3-dioxygenase-like lactoylglutathione lyase family enzyme